MTELYCNENDNFQIYRWAPCAADSDLLIATIAAPKAFEIARANAERSGCEINPPRPCLTLTEGPA